MGQVTQLLDAAREGNASARGELFAVVYGQLRRMAAASMKYQRNGHTLSPTALVHEAALKMLGGDCLAKSRDRAMFFALAAQAMRCVLVDHARRRNARKRTAGISAQPISPEDIAASFERAEAIDLLALDEALDQLRRQSVRQHEVVMLRFFGGLPLQEIADYLEVSLSTVEKDWSFSRAWLRRSMGTC